MNFLNPERKVQEVTAGTALAWTSVTTGNLAGIDLWLDEARAGVLRIETNIVSGDVDLGQLADGIGRPSTAAGLAASSASIDYRRPTGADELTLEHQAVFKGGARPAGLRARDAGGRPSSLVEPDLFDRIGGVTLPICASNPFHHHSSCDIFFTGLGVTGGTDSSGGFMCRNEISRATS